MLPCLVKKLWYIMAYSCTALRAYKVMEHSSISLTLVEKREGGKESRGVTGSMNGQNQINLDAPLRSVAKLQLKSQSSFSFPFWFCAQAADRVPACFADLYIGWSPDS